MNKAKKQRIIFVASVFVLSMGALIFVIVNFRDNIVFFYSPSEVLQQEVKSKIINKNFRLGGLVKKGSINKLNAVETKFIVTDNKAEIMVQYKGILPNLFKEGQGVIAKGKLTNKIFIASELLVKHDENYIPLEVRDAIKLNN